MIYRFQDKKGNNLLFECSSDIQHFSSTTPTHQIVIKEVFSTSRENKGMSSGDTRALYPHDLEWTRLELDPNDLMKEIL